MGSEMCIRDRTVGTVPVFVGSVPFFLCRVNAPYYLRFSRLCLVIYQVNVFLLDTKVFDYKDNTQCKYYKEKISSTFSNVYKKLILVEDVDIAGCMNGIIHTYIFINPLSEGHYTGC